MQWNNCLHFISSAVQMVKAKVKLSINNQYLRAYIANGCILYTCLCRSKRHSTSVFKEPSSRFLVYISSWIWDHVFEGLPLFLFPGGFHFSIQLWASTLEPAPTIRHYFYQLRLLLSIPFTFYLLFHRYHFYVLILIPYIIFVENPFLQHW